MLTTMRQRNFSLLWFAGLISITGNWMLSIALPVVIYQMTGSALAVGGMLLAQMLPGILFSSVAGIFVDRWERRQTMIIVNLLLAVTILPLLLVRSVEWLGLIYVVSFVQSALSQFYVPAEKAFLPLLSDPKLLVSANTLNALNNNLARLIGPALGGFAAAFLGLGGVVVIDAATFVIAAILTALITVKSQPAKASTAADSSALRKVFDEWIDGFRLIWREKRVRVLFLISIPPAIGESVISVLLVPFVTQVLHGNSVHVGGLMSAQAVGGLIGGALIGWVAPHIATKRLFGVSAIIFGLLDLVLFNYSTFFTSMAVAYLLIASAGPFVVGFGAAYNTLLQTDVADAYRGRVFGAFGLISALFGVIGIVIAGGAADTLGIVPVINIQGYVYILAGVLSLILL